GSCNRPLGTEADKQNLERTFEFGHFLMDMVHGLTTDAVSGALPINVKLRSGEVLTEFCGVRDQDVEKSYPQPAERRLFIERRCPIATKSVIAKRSPIVNLRISCELLIFISQTGMNLAQAFNIKRGQFRYQTDGNDVLVYRAYKGRRGGEVEFTAFKEYSSIFKSYLDWLDALCDVDEDRLFPYIYWHKIPSSDNLPAFSSVISRCRTLGIKYFGPAALRKTRINWLLRKTRDPDLVSEIAQHSKEVLLGIYEEPHHQVAAIEISRFYQAIDPAVPSAGPGMCLSPGNPQSQTPVEGAYVPDCTTPAGCLFCDYQRDLDTEDYVWSLTSYRHLKLLELDRYIPPEKQLTTHPAILLIEKINTKLAHYSEGNEYRARWVAESAARMREGRFHPFYEGLINMLELTQ
ncbi:site-specific integrase, partial [Pseudomonas amygdali]|uniref:site-specific integrase n=1 Tax=Pseudomonas amygdali TaxID=47877 RepID=UPI000AB1B51B